MLYNKPGIDVQLLLRFAFRRTTVTVASALRANFYKVGHRNEIGGPRDTEEKDLDEANVTVSRLHIDTAL